jgi:hypothetical protein
MNETATRSCRVPVCGAGIMLVLLMSFPASVHAQGYGEQRSIPFRVHGQDVSTRLSREATRQSISLQREALSRSGSSAAGGAAGGAGTAQSTTGLNNVVQYYDNSSLTLNVPGSYTTVTVGDTLNAGQTSDGTRQSASNTSNSSLSPAAGSLRNSTVRPQ